MQIKSSRKVALVVTALLIGVIASESALAHGRRGGGRVSIGIGVGFGVPFAASPFYRPYYPPYYYSPYYYPPAYYPPVVLAPPVYITPAPPPVYVEQPPVQQPAPMYQPQMELAPQPGSQPSTNVWYYCNESQTYYPYVKQCPAGWQQVTPQPQG